MEDVREEPLFVQRVAGLDIAKAGVEVAIRVPSDTGSAAGGGAPHLRHHPPRAGVAGGLAARLGRGQGRMEATSDYWNPVFFLLESRGFDYDLYNAAQVRALPGRPKTDRADSVWLAKVTTGDDRRQLRAARADPPAADPHPVPPAPHPGPHRREAAGRVMLEDGHLKLSSVISDIHGVSGRDMLDALAAGQRDPRALAAMARGKMRGEIRRLEEALECSFFTAEHAAVLAMMLAVIDHYTAQISQLTATIEELAGP